jgi:hypothetical protein
MRRIDNAQEVFFSRIRKDEKTGCWFWLGSIDPKGYGRIKIIF